MKHIAIKSLRLAQFRSFSRATTIDLSAAPGLKLISGQNDSEPSLGANGAGKSSIWDAVCWCFYGFSIRGLRTSDLKTHGAQSTEATVTLVINDQEVVIRRYGPPDRMQINGSPVRQEEIEALIGLSRARFLNAVIFGQGIPLFIDLPRPRRGELLDEVLELELWMEAAKQATEEHNSRSDILIRVQGDIREIQGTLRGLPDVDALHAQEQEWDRLRDERLKSIFAKYDAAQERLNTAQSQTLKKPDTAPVTEAKLRYSQQLDRVMTYQRWGAEKRAHLNAIEGDLTFFAENDKCPVCKQPITKEFQHGHVAHLEGQKNELVDEIGDLDKRLQVALTHAKQYEADWQQANAEIAASERAQAVLKERIKAIGYEMHDLQQQATRCRNERNPYSEQRNEAEAHKHKLEDQLFAKQAEELDRTTELAQIHYWRQGFRKVRAFCLENVLRELSVETRNSLLALGLIDWRIQFKSFDESERGTIRLGVEIDVQPPQRAAGQLNILSGGEGQRARLAASLGLANLIQRYSGVNYRWEVWDEPTAWLSERGVENLLDCLATRSTASHRSIYLCDHRALQHSGFSENFLVKKDASGSHWSRV